MYRILLIMVIVLFLMRILWRLREGNRGFVKLNYRIQNIVKLLFKRLILSKSRSDIFNRLRYFFISITVFSFLILVLTSIIPVVLLGKEMGGFFLVVHVSIAPFFVVALMFTAIFLAPFQQFDYSDFTTLKKLLNKKEDRETANDPYNFWPKVYFWSFLIFSVPAVLSIILAMFNYFGTEGQIALLNIHRYSTLVLFVITLFYAELKLFSSDRLVKNG